MYKCWAQYIYNLCLLVFVRLKKVSDNLWQFVFYFVLCKICTGKKKCSLVVVLSLAVIELAKVIKSARGGRGDGLGLFGTLWLESSHGRVHTLYTDGGVLTEHSTTLQVIKWSKGLSVYRGSTNCQS